MSFLINDELIWVAVPKCATISVERACLLSNLKIKEIRKAYLGNNIWQHCHYTTAQLYDHFGIKETVCIKRDWFKRWLSGFEYIYESIEDYNLGYNLKFKTIKKFKNINNKYIFNTFTDKICNDIHNMVGENEELNESTINVLNTFFKPNWKNIKRDKLNHAISLIQNLISKNHWISNKKCTYEFDINNLKEFESFIEEKFGEKIVFEKLNETKKISNKMIINDELKNFIWEKFEKRFEKKTNLI